MVTDLAASSSSSVLVYASCSDLVLKMNPPNRHGYTYRADKNVLNHLDYTSRIHDRLAAVDCSSRQYGSGRATLPPNDAPAVSALMGRALAMYGNAIIDGIVKTDIIAEKRAD